jgi:hypothetical protein
VSGIDLRVAILIGAAAIAAVFVVAILVIAGHQPTSGGGGPQVGDTISVPTAPRPEGEGCRLALLSGTLVMTPDWVVAVGDDNEPQLVFWPDGFHAQLTEHGADLLGRDGRLVARTGDQVRASGGLGRIAGREGFVVCASDLHFEPANP